MVRLDPRLLRLLALIVVIAFSLGGRAVGYSRSAQIILAGNFDGRAVIWNGNGGTSPSDAWKIPFIVRDFKKLKEYSTLVVDVGNNVSAYSPASFLLGENVDMGILDSIGVGPRILGAQDLLSLGSVPQIRDSMYHKIWTNVERHDVGFSFPSFKTHVAGDFTIAFAGMIDPAVIEDVPLEDFGDFTIEDPVRSYRRLQFEAGKVDRIYLFSHLSPAGILELLPILDRKTVVIVFSEEILRQPGIRSHLERNPGSLLALSPGVTHLNMLRLEKREGGPLTEKLVRLPLAEPYLRTDEAAFSAIREQVEHGRRSSAWVINTREVPKGISYRFSPASHAKFAKELLGSDIGLIACPEEPFQRNRFLGFDVVADSFPNRFLREYLVPVAEAKRLFLAVSRGKVQYRIGIDGASVSFLGGDVRDFSLGKRGIDPGGTLRVVLDEILFRDPNIGKVLESCRLARKAGRTIWSAWMKGLVKFPHLAGMIEKDLGR